MPRRAGNASFPVASYHMWISSLLVGRNRQRLNGIVVAAVGRMALTALGVPDDHAIGGLPHHPRQAACPKRRMPDGGSLRGSMDGAEIVSRLADDHAVNAIAPAMPVHGGKPGSWHGEMERGA